MAADFRDSRLGVGQPSPNGFFHAAGISKAIETEKMQALCDAQKLATNPLAEKNSWRSCRPAPGFPLLTRWLTQGLAKTRGGKSIDSQVKDI